MSFIKDYKTFDDSRTFIEHYPKYRELEQKRYHASYIQSMTPHLAINPGKRCPGTPSTSDQAFFYPIKFERN